MASVTQLLTCKNVCVKRAFPAKSFSKALSASTSAGGVVTVVGTSVVVVVGVSVVVALKFAFN